MSRFALAQNVGELGATKKLIPIRKSFEYPLIYG